MLTLVAAGCGGSDGSDSTPPTASAVEPPPGVRSTRPIFTEVTVELGLGDVAQQDRGSVDDAVLGPAEIMTGGVAVVDVDGDGWEDLYIPRVRLPDVLRYNAQGRGFVAAPTGTLPASAADSHGTSAWGDLDGDGDLDVVVGGIGDGETAVYRQEDDGTFSDQTEASGLRIDPNAQADEQLVFGLALSDLETDGDLDLVVSGWRHNPGAAPGQTGVWRNDGVGGFSEVPDAIPGGEEIAAFTATAADVDGDGTVDLAIAADWGLSRLVLGNGDVTFTDVTAEAGVGTDENGMGAVVADLDADGDLDWFVSSLSAPTCDGPVDTSGPTLDKGCTGNRLYVNDGSGGFADGTDAFGVREGDWGWGADSGDLDNDGDLDLVQTNGFRTASPAPENERYTEDVNRVFFNDGADGLVEDAEAVGLGNDGDGKALVTVDIDHDGDLDVVQVDTVDGVRLFRNDGPAAGAWIEVTVQDAAGAPVMEGTVTVRAGDRAWRRDLRIGDSYLAQRPAVAHVGLGAGDPTGGYTVSVALPGDESPRDLGPVTPGTRTALVLP